MDSYILEACVDSVASAIHAIEGGANRLELCSNLIIGGTTPSVALYQAIRKRSNIKIHVLIRPRFGDFCYTEDEFEIMKEEIKLFKALGVDGVVIGMLKPDGALDALRMKVLIDEAEGLSITLHRAFDVCREPYKVLEESKQLGIHTILTSGQQDYCMKGKALIKDLVICANGEIDILVAGGVSAEMIREMREDTHVSSYHMSGKVIKDSQMQYRKEGVNMGLKEMSEYTIWETKKEAIEAVKQLLEVIQ